MKTLFANNIVISINVYGDFTFHFYAKDQIQASIGLQSNHAEDLANEIIKKRREFLAHNKKKI